VGGDLKKGKLSIRCLQEGKYMRISKPPFMGDSHSFLGAKTGKEAFNFLFRRHVIIHDGRGCQKNSKPKDRKEKTRPSNQAQSVLKSSFAV